MVALGKDQSMPAILATTFDSFEYVLPKKAINDKRYINESNASFISLNRDTLEFLGIQPVLNDKKIVLETSTFVGAAPLRIPGKISKPLSDIIIRPRYNAEQSLDWFAWISELAEYSDYEINLERNVQLKLTRTNGSKPPKFILAKDVVNAFYPVLQKQSWYQFESLKVVLQQPKGKINWSEYARRSYQPEKRLEFPTTLNRLSQNHQEFERALSILKESIRLLRGNEAPQNIRIGMAEKLNRTSHLLNNFKQVSNSKLVTEKFFIQQSDALDVQKLKVILNNYIENFKEDKYAWRVDFSELFERYVQKIISQVVIISAHNEKISRFVETKKRSSNKILKLLPKYLEPDLVVEINDQIIVIDAKYKSYFYPRSQSVTLTQRERLRADVHQVLAYANLKNAKIGVLIAPTADVDLQVEVVKYAGTKIAVIGLPIDIKKIQYLRTKLRKVLEDLVKD